MWGGFSQDEPASVLNLPVPSTDADVLILRTIARVAGGAAARICELLDVAHVSREPEKMVKKKRKTFSTSRKMDAARRGAEAVSLDCRSR